MKTQPGITVGDTLEVVAAQFALYNEDAPVPNKAQPQHSQGSPLPWQIINGGLFDDSASMVFPAATKRDEANVRLIVRAVNHADKLAEALRMACKVIEGENLDEAMAGEYEILTDALAAYESEAQP